MKFFRFKADAILIIHFLLGVFAGNFPAFVFYWTLLFFIYSLVQVVTSSRPAYIYAAYLVGMELLMRMSQSGVPHEFTKYAVTLLLIVEIFKSRKPWPSGIVIYALVLLPAAFITQGKNLEETRQLISQNLSGPLCLVAATVYFYNRAFNISRLKLVITQILFPLAAILGYLFIQTPDLSTIDFGYGSNFEASVYGPNQMSSILGLGILLIGVCYLMKIRLFESYVVLVFFVGMLAFRGLLTFSRGGMLTSIIILVLIAVFLFWKTIRQQRYFFRTAFYAGIIGILFLFTFRYTNQITGNALLDRYTGKKANQQVESIDEITSGRTLIILIDWQIFLDHPVLGIGAGMGKFFRQSYGYSISVAAHNEFSRMLAEHGFFGVVGIIILLFLPIKRFVNANSPIERVIIIMSVGFCFVFMTHSATRLAAPCFLYGLTFIKVRPNIYMKRTKKDHCSITPQLEKFNFSEI